MRIRFVLFILLAVLVSCAKQSTVPTSQEDILYQVEGFFIQKPDSALQILDTLNGDVLSEKERAHYCLLKVKVRDQFFLYDNITDSLLQVAEDYFIGSKEKYFEAEIRAFRRQRTQMRRWRENEEKKKNKRKSL